MGLFDKKYCDICGEKIGLLGNRSLEDGNCYKSCAGKLSPWFSDRRRSTVDDIRRQLAYREENRGKAAQFQITREIGESWRVLIDETHGWFTVARGRDLAETNPDILDFAQLTGWRPETSESRTELKRTGNNGEQVSFNPPRYEYSYDFYMTITVNTPYFGEMRFKPNRSTVDVQSEASAGGGSSPPHPESRRSTRHTSASRLPDFCFFTAGCDIFPNKVVILLFHIDLIMH